MRGCSDKRAAASFYVYRLATLGLTQEDLAEMARVGLSTVKD